MTQTIHLVSLYILFVRNTCVRGECAATCCLLDGHHCVTVEIHPWKSDLRFNRTSAGNSKSQFEQSLLENITEIYISYQRQLPSPAIRGQ